MDKALAVLMSIAAGIGLVKGNVKDSPQTPAVQGYQTETVMEENGNRFGYMNMGGNSNRPSGPTGKLTGISNAIQKLERNMERQIERKSGPTGFTGNQEENYESSGPTGPTGEGNAPEKSESVNLRSGFSLPPRIPTMAIGNSKALEIADPSGTSYPLPPGRERNR